MASLRAARAFLIISVLHLVLQCFVFYKSESIYTIFLPIFALVLLGLGISSYRMTKQQQADRQAYLDLLEKMENPQVDLDKFL